MAKTTVPGLYIADGAITAAKLSSTLDLSGVTITVATASTGDSDTSVASTAFVQQEIAALVDSSPSALNTLNELAAAIGDDASFSTTVTNSIATKLPLAGGTLTGNLIINTTGSIQIPVGTTAQRPTAAQGQLRFNTTTSKPEIYSGSAWTDVGGGVESVNSATGVVVLTTANIAENTNLYYTDARADARIAAADTDDLSEGSTNLYFTTARANSAFDGRLSGSTGVTVSNGAVSIGQDVATSTSPTFQNLTLSGTNSIKVPSGTTAQRSGSPANGMLRYNSSTNEFEGYADSAWGAIGGDTTSSVDLYTATGNGSTATYDTGKNPQSENNTWVFVGGVYQPKSTYSFSGTQITLSENLPNGEDLEVITGTVSTYNPTDAILGQYNVTTSNTASYNTSLTTENENNVFVFVDGVYQPKSSYTYSGSTLTLDAVPTSGMSLEVLVTRSMNAATVTTGFLADDAVTTAKITDANVTAGKLASSLDLTGKTVTVATASAGDNDTSVASTAFVRQEITSLVDSAPAAMDTLNELAAALGDDANFSTTVNNSIALKAPLASPTFTGTAEIPNLTTGGQQGTDGQLLTSTGSGIAWEDAPATLTFKTFGTDSIMIGDTTTGTINNANKNVGLGVNVFQSLTTGDNNVAIGYDALSSLQSQGGNVAIGYQAGKSVVSGYENVFIGLYSGINAVHREAIAIGSYSMYSNVGTTSGDIGIGMGAMQYKNANLGNTIAIGTYAHRGGNTTTGRSNIAIGPYAMQAITTGTYNTAVGDSALTGITTGTYNVAIGPSALYANTTASYNTAIGRDSLKANTTGDYNNALGATALDANTTGRLNIAIGYAALGANTTGDSNVAIGHAALDANTTASNNTAIGTDALSANTTAFNNTAVGYASSDANTTGENNASLGASSLTSNTTGSSNTAIGMNALRDNTTASNNTAVGLNALLQNTTGDENTAVGALSLDANTTGTDNTALGYQALSANTTASNNVSIGRKSMLVNTTGAKNTAVGAQALDANTTANQNTAVGYQALTANTTGAKNVALGADNMLVNTTGANNVALGYGALQVNTTASNNTAVGYLSLFSNTTGHSNVSVGAYSIYANTQSNRNTALGYNTLSSHNLTSDINGYNTVVGFQAGADVTTGVQNTFIGGLSGDANTTASNNTAVGYASLGANTTGTSNTAVGQGSLQSNTTASNNTAVGLDALVANTTGPFNTAVGVGALGTMTTGQQNTAVGYHAAVVATTGLYNTAVGLQAARDLTSGSNNHCFGYRAGDNTSHFHLTTQTGRLIVGNNGTTNAYVQVAWTVVSDARDKTEVEDIGVGLDLINDLRPVSYKFTDNRENKNPVGRTKYGFLAQEVLSVEGQNPVIIDDEEEEKLKMTTDNLTAVLVKAVQELSTQVDELKAEIQELKE